MKASTLKRYRFELLLAGLVLLTFLFGLFPALVERWYSTGIYPLIGWLMRFLFGWIPFSVGDILYVLTVLFLLYKLIGLVKKWRRKELNAFVRKRILRKLIRTFMIVYLVFQWLWGLNYHRLGTSYQLGIQPSEYSSAELQQLTDTLQQRLDVLIATMQPYDSLAWKNFDSSRSICIRTYKQAGKTDPMLRYKISSVKAMLSSSVGGYGGFSGYLNPFTGEAQVAGELPGYLQPYVTCHEMAHQMGYAAEEEANLVGYLACKSSENRAMRYSVYHDLLMYAAREMYSIDTTAYKQLMDSMPALVKQHHQQAKAYYAQFKNPWQLLLNKWYDMYLKANSQEKGVRSYSYVTAWLIAYAKKYGWQKL